MDPGRWCTAEDVWDRTPLALELAGDDEHIGLLAAVIGELAAALAGCVDVAADLATAHEPASLDLAVEDAERFLEQAPAELDRLGIELIGPERLVRGRRVGARHGDARRRRRTIPAPSGARPSSSGGWSWPTTTVPPP